MQTFSLLIENGVHISKFPTLYYTLFTVIIYGIQTLDSHEPRLTLKVYFLLSCKSDNPFRSK